MSRIVTHPGGAHMDDLFATALVLALDPDVELIERRMNTVEDLEDPLCWVLDLGGRIEPAKRNFDHHHLPDGAPDCTFTLVADHHDLNPWLAENAWYEPAQLLDSLGAWRAADQLGCEPRMVGAIYTPSDEFFILRFGALKKLGSTDPFFQLLRDLGHDMVDGVRQDQERQALLEREAEIVDVKGIQTVLFLADVPDGTRGIDRFMRDRGGAGLSVSADSRGDGWSLQRLQEHPRVDFRRVIGRDGVLFVHNTGFVAKVATDDKEYIMQLLHEAVV